MAKPFEIEPYSPDYGEGRSYDCSQIASNITKDYATLFPESPVAYDPRALRGIRQESQMTLEIVENDLIIKAYELKRFYDTSKEGDT